MIMILSLYVLVQTTKYKNGRRHEWFLQPTRPATAKLVGSVHARREKKHRFLSPDVGVYIRHISNTG